MLEIQNVSKTFNAGTVNQKTALNGLNLKLNEGDFVTVIGGNGAGKSTMLNAVAGVWPVDEGKIIIDGVDVTRLSEHQRAAYIGRVFQDPMRGTAADMQIQGQKLDKYAKVRRFSDAKKTMLKAIGNDLETRFAELRKQGKLALFVAHTDNYAAAEQFAQEIREAFPDIPVTDCDPLSLSVSCHIGPDALAVAVSIVY